MPRYAPEPPYNHGTSSRIGILLINLGTPEAPTASAVRRYLREFLADPRVVEIWRPLWWLILNLFILPLRPRQSAQRYAQIWMSDGSPLKVHTERQSKLLRGFLGERLKVPLAIDYAMRYGKPSVADALTGLKQQGCGRVLVLPLYPQYAASTTATAMDAVGAVFAATRNQPALRSVRNFHDHPGYIAALAQNISDYWLQHGRPEQLIMSFHGVPRYTLDKGDPYHCECHKTARLLTEALRLGPADYQVTFQSRFGRAEWLQPYTAAVLRDLGRQKLGRVDVVCPGFISDCLETLEEIAIEGKTIFLNAGGKDYHYISCLNERDDWIHALADIVATNLLGWAGAEPAAETLQRSRAQALAAGAKN
ncbi:MAG: ferrochelatase [Betaproteobacteria bacterium]|nr:ferrochelatase [Betaproteobacteria bacterium]